jgi:cation:H+ antiporter
MLLAAASILFGFVALIWSANVLVAGAASIARNLGISPLIIGLTIVSLGTSAPEILVSLTASLSHAGPLAIGNAIGSNIANIALVLGVTALVAPLMVDEQCLRREIPVLLLATVGVGALILDGALSIQDGCLMLAAMALIIAFLVFSQPGRAEQAAKPSDEPMPELPPLRAWSTFLFGLLVLILSSKLLVWGAVIVAEELGISELIIGLTVVAVGTSLPELAASIASALRGHTEIAFGNIIGSNLFNLLAVMAIPGVVGGQMLDPEAISRDYASMAALTFFLAFAIFVSAKRSKSAPKHAYIGRIMGTVLVSSYALYYYFLLTTQ